MKNETSSQQFSCYLVTKDESSGVQANIAERSLSDLPDGEVLIRVDFSSLNYKDALAATGHPGVVRKFPHVPGIDAAGDVVKSNSDHLQEGDQVLVTGYELGAGHWGGWAGYIRVPEKWVVKLPDGLTPRDAMKYGTAGLTAAISIDALQHHGVTPDSGDVVVTGATGGVGIMSVMLLAKLGYSVVAVTGKPQEHDRLIHLGAARVIARGDVDDDSGKPMLAAKWAGAVDSVGGNTLATLLRQTNNGGCVAACGLVGGVEVPLTVYPFLLRGVTLSGIDSAWFPYDRRTELWRNLAGPWRLDYVDEITTEISLEQLDEFVKKVLAGENVGRVIVSLPS